MFVLIFPFDSLVHSNSVLLGDQPKLQICNDYRLISRYLLTFRTANTINICQKTLQTKSAFLKYLNINKCVYNNYLNTEFQTNSLGMIETHK